MPIQTMQSIAEHQFFKAATPLVATALIGSVTWLFVTVMELDKELHKISDAEIPVINRDLEDAVKTIQELEKQVINLRIKFAGRSVRIDDFQQDGAREYIKK